MPQAILSPSQLEPSHRVVGIVLVVLWVTTGANFLGFRIAVESLPPMLMIGTRLLVAGLILLPVAWLLGERAWPTRRQIRSILVSALLLLVIGQGALVWAVQSLPAGTTAMLSSAVPLWVAVLGWLFFSVRIGRQALIGLGLGFCGLVLLALTSSGDDGGFNLAAAGIMLVGTVGWALGSLLDHRADPPQSPTLTLALQMLTAGTILMAGAAITGELASFDPGVVTTRSWWALAYLIVVGSIIGFGAFAWLNRHASDTVVSSFSYVSPIVALGLSAWLLDEQVTLTKVVAGAVSLLGVALMVSGEPSPARPGYPPRAGGQA